MKTSFIAAAAAAGLFAAINTAQAQFYGSLSAGPAFVGDANFRDPATADLSIDYGTGWTINGALGYRFSPMVRGEIELGYLSADGSGPLTENILTIAACGNTPQQPCLDRDVDADLTAKTALASAFVDIPTGTAVTPYIGAGMGLMRQSLDIVGVGRTAQGAASPFTVMDDGSTEFAYRGALGFAFDMGSMEGDIGYTYTRSSKPTLSGRSSFISFDYDRPVAVHAITAKVRLDF
ncbi:MAG: porin family protein [Rhodobacteraceae bacterium]|nr:porin family protein [Paracoccaceae bacterium]